MRDAINYEIRNMVFDKKHGKSKSAKYLNVVHKRS